MQIDDLWRALEADAAAGTSGRDGWLMRLARPAADCRLFVGLELASRRRAVFLALPPKLLPPRRAWPRSKGLDATAVDLEGQAHFGVLLKEPRFADVFTALAEDLVRRVSEAVDPAAQARVFLGQLARWQKFLSAPHDGLSDEAQRGLWGELYFLRERLLPLFGSGAINAWMGAQRAHQDFQFGRRAVEVKTTLAKQPQVVRITSERQLDGSALDALFLNVMALDAGDGRGETLPCMVMSIREKIADDASAQDRFEDELLLAGYMDSHAPRYAGRGYTVRAANFFRVGSRFPCLVESDMPSGVGDANYALSVSACEQFKVDAREVDATLATMPVTKKKRRSRG